MTGPGENPLLSESLFVGRDAVLARTRSLLATGQSVLLIGGRRTGKSTIVRHIAGPEIGREVFSTDVLAWDTSSESTALGALHAVLRREPETAHPHATRDDIVTRLDGLEKCTILIDEADKLLSTPWVSEFFSFLRWFDDNRYRSRLSFLLTGGPSLARFRDPHDRGSPPLNSAKIQFLEPLDAAAIAELGELAVCGSDTDEIMAWSGGNAWLATRLLAAMWTGMTFDEATEEIYDEAAEHLFPVWRHQADEQCLDLFRMLPADGLTANRLLVGDMAHYREAFRNGRSVGILRVDDGRCVHGPRPFSQWLGQRRAP